MAIAFDSSVDGGSPGVAGVLSWTHTTVGASTLMVIGAFYSSGNLSDTVTCTVDAVSANLIVSGVQGTGGTAGIIFFAINGLSAGAHAVVVTDVTNTGAFMSGGSSAYTGALGGVDISTTSDSASASSFTTTLNPVVTNGWTVIFSRWSGNNISAGTGTNLRQPPSGNTYFLGDSNGAVSGSVSMTINDTSGGVGTVMLSLSPTAASGAFTVNRNLNLLGVGQ